MDVLTETQNMKPKAQPPGQAKTVMGLASISQDHMLSTKKKKNREEEGKEGLIEERKNY